MKKKITFAVLLALLVISGAILKMRLDAIDLEYRERSFVLDAALDKEKSYDGRRHEFKMTVSVRIHSSDLFKFNDSSAQLARLYYQHVLDTEAKIGPQEIQDMKLVMTGFLQIQKIGFQDLNINIIEQ